ncbi:MAG: hybrid sensor histidine kinase/response regulator [Acaryochloris sp. RU_4_1]|nr:hybrid sensor histidine kinase/response regulator [Acaryochloris sp. SU_5_25]NJM66082.1 hybrid sensor histidine kinase/response regulator [Acaryochloris sp. RU_4_1]NJR53733.1 hybrid sensor histidine kinase/response regulator [Acaryochloris sp. CRU_2_0]
MLFEQTTVRAFLQKTLTCQSATPIQELFDVLQDHSGSGTPTFSTSTPSSESEPPTSRLDLSQLVVVNEQQQPVGLLPLSQFIHLFLEEQQLDYALSPDQPIATWVNLHHHPLQCVPETYSLKQFWHYLQTFAEGSSLSWAIVKASTGEYLGLLDAPRLIQFLAQNTPLSVAIKFSSDLKSSLSPNLGLSPTIPPNPGLTSLPAQPPPSTTPVRADLSPELLAEISHELKSPLTAVLSLSNVLSHQGISTLSKRQMQYVQLIHQKSQQLMSIVNHLLDLTQIHSHPQAESRTTVKLDRLCKDAIAQAKRHYALEQGTTDTTVLSVQLFVGDPYSTLTTDELKLGQILVYLLHNAFNLSNGQSAVQLQVEAWQEWVLFTIQDTGIGIPSQQQDRVFQFPQTWTHPALETLAKTGLGLIVAQRLAEQLAGDISFVSNPESGNRFTLWLPTDPGWKSKTTDNTRGLVLIAACDSQLINPLTQHLTQRSLRTVIARSMPDILQKINTFHPQAILLQATLAPSSSEEILATLSQNDYPQPILLIGREEDCQRTLEAGAKDCLTLGTLDQTLDQWLDQWLTQLPRPEDTRFPCDQRGITPPPLPSPAKKLTVLHLDPSSDPVAFISSVPEIIQALQRHHWRVVSTTTVEEAELLANIWNPNVVLYTADDPAPLLQISPDSPIAQYPAVILNPEVLKVVNERGILRTLITSALAAKQSTPELSVASLLFQILEEIPFKAEQAK